MGYLQDVAAPSQALCQHVRRPRAPPASHKARRLVRERARGPDRRRTRSAGDRGGYNQAHGGAAASVGMTMKRLFQRQSRGRGHQRRELECLYCGKLELVDAREEAAYDRRGCTTCRGGGDALAQGDALAATFRQMIVRHQLRHVTGPDRPCAWPELVRRFERLAVAGAGAQPQPAPHPCEACYWRAEEEADGVVGCALELDRAGCGTLAVVGERAAV